MARHVVAIVTGFTKSPTLLERSLAPLIALRHAGIIHRILYLTWDKPELDGFVAPAGQMADVELVRVPQPEADGAPHQKGVIYQIRSLEAALERVADKNALIVKIRPDFVADKAFLREKIVNFDSLCAPSPFAKRFGVAMPPSPFAAKIWLPWADSNQPFFFEDATFIGLKRDVAKLASREAERHLGVLADKECGWFAHVVRFATVFTPAYPIFKRYVENFRYFPNDLDYRRAMLPEMTGDAFFWHLLVANAWILATSFHIDCGQPGQLTLFTNTSNADADWTNFQSLKPNSPYDDVELWRAGQKPGGMMPCAARAYGRLVDDSWAHALFTRPVLNDLTPDNLRGVLRNIALYQRGLLAEAENAFYRRLAALHRNHRQAYAA